HLLTRQLRRKITAQPVIVTSLPLTADLIGRVPAARWVYYCVDDFSAWPGLDCEALLAMERTLVAKVDRIIAVSAALQERIKTMGRTSELLTHGVDLEFWMQRGGMDHESRRIVFWGVIDQRMDTEFVRALAAARLGTIVFVGPQNEPDPELLALPGV